MTAELTQNPFASTHSLDANPFDDPVTPAHAETDATRLEQLRQRERELDQREQELNRRAEHIRTHGKNNWPPCLSSTRVLSPALTPARSAVAPIIYHSIKEEIPEASQPLITRLYQLWLVLVATLIVNMVACVFILTAGSYDGGRDVGVSIASVLPLGCCSSLTVHQVSLFHQYCIFSALVSVSHPVICLFNRLSPGRPIYNGYMKVNFVAVKLQFTSR
jgi:secretory carrier-associated membrane protein